MKRQSNSLTPKRKGMAQEKTPNEKPKRTRKPKAGSDALPVEQITELMLVHNKNDPKFGVQAVSEIDKDGKAKTVPADEKNENSFLKFDKNSSILENFIKNFWSQLKEPTHFRLLRTQFFIFHYFYRYLQNICKKSIYSSHNPIFLISDTISG